MGDLTPHILVLTSWISNCLSKRKEKKMSKQYQDADSLLFFRPVDEQDLPRIIALEEEGYPADEKASPQALRFRAAQAGDLFLTAVKPVKGKDVLVGYVCGTLTTSPELTHESMAQHDPQGQLLCIHSVCVDSSYRRSGIAKRMLAAYLLFVQQTSPQVASVRLISKQHLTPLYAGAGFTNLGPSSVVHGKDQWIEMEYKVPAGE